MSLLSRSLTALVFGTSLWPAQANDFSIVNGEEVARNSYPWFASIGVKHISDAYDAHSCGGSLIHPSWVLTAAHCFDSDDEAGSLSVTVGRHRLRSNEGVRVAVKRLIRHPQFDNNDHDIALVELAEPIQGVPVAKLGSLAELPAPGTDARAIGHGGLAAPLDFLIDRYQPVGDCYSGLAACLAEIEQQGVTTAQMIDVMLSANGSADRRLGIGYAELLTLLRQRGGTPTASMSVEALVAALETKKVTLLEMVRTIRNAAIGSDALHEVTLPLVDNATCRSAGYSPSDNMLCAGYINQPKDTCQGDSGGPLFVRHGNDWRQIGIVSFGATCATTYGVYTKLANYVDWIGSHVPRFNEDRLFAWGENAARSILKPGGNERSVMVGPYYARLYPNSNTAIGSDGKTVYFYDGRTILPLGALDGFLNMAVKDRY
ncbi:S1 family peptidase [Chitinimonas lacunae]|uniref:S1 family peptidase n=1 Tax=Chitinimonas lacunae TaxID=1963018 RepID=A0ABV8MU55_9NEIS